MTKKNSLFIALILLCGLSFAQKVETANPTMTPPSETKTASRQIPVEDFFKNPEKSMFRLSKKGSSIAYLSPVKRRMNIFVEDTKENKATQVTRFDDRDVSSFFWKTDKRIILSKDVDGDENFGIYAVNADGSEFKAIAEKKGVRYEIIDDLPNDDNHVLVTSNERNPEIFDVLYLDITNGLSEVVAENPGDISSWIADHNGNIRIAISTDGVKTSFLYREDKNKEWKKILTTNFKETFYPIVFSSDNKSVYCSSNIGRDKAAIVKVDPTSAKELEVIFADKNVDVSDAHYSEAKKAITYINYSDDLPKKHIIDKFYGRLFGILESKVPGYQITLVSSDINDTKFIVRSWSDVSQGAYYFFDITSGEFKKLSDLSPWLIEKEMCKMEPITYISRDGLTIHGYLTIPSGGPQKNIPVIILPHGGPWARDEWGFNSEVQFLANRGYAVLQVNFRGSTGYGREFMERGFKQWGLAMQDDLSDGVKFVTQSGIGDPNRIAIYGASYGGYATLCGMTLTPDLYACGIDYVGVSNLFSFMNTIPPYWKPYLEMMYEMVGNPEKDEAQFKATSPAFHADKIKAPLFIAQGAKDPRVNVEESNQMVAALKERNIPVTYMLKENEGHGFRNEENRIEFYHAIGEFLEKNLN